MGLFRSYAKFRIFSSIFRAVRKMRIALEPFVADA